METTRDGRGERHGMAGTPLYKVWGKMRERCRDPHDAKYSIYGARGIRVCERWDRSFAAFCADMGPRPAGMTIERINTDGHYEPDNCRWASMREQNNNRRDNHRIEYGGETLTISEWARRTGFRARTIWHRIRSNWAPERALTEPPKIGKNQFGP